MVLIRDSRNAMENEMRDPIVTMASPVMPFVYGGKAHWISWMHENGYNVPYAVFMPAMEPNSFRGALKNREYVSRLRELLEPMVMRDEDKEIYDVAIRSSAPYEDAQSSSLAGHFRSILGRITFAEVLNAVVQVAKSIDEGPIVGSRRMGVIVQKRIEAKFSGVAISSNPVSGSKRESVLSIISGMGAPLVSGKMAGEDIVLQDNETSLQIPKYSTDMPEDYCRQIWEIAKAIEGGLGYPIDIEWCVQQITGELYILQCRPATGVLYEGRRVIIIERNTEKELPAWVKSNNKITLRLLGEKTGILVSRASVVIADCRRDPPSIPDLNTIRPTKHCKGYSVVLIYPETLLGKVTRAFLEQRAGARSFLKVCRRYTIRAYPKFQTLLECIETIAQKCVKYYWDCAIIIQEIYDPVYAGIIKRIKDGYMIELAYGHFIPKGVVTTSQYVVSPDGSLLYSNEVRQTRRFRILEGHILEEEIDPSRSLVSIRSETLLRIIHDFEVLLKNEQTAIEFGLLDESEKQEPVKTLRPYLIDLIEESSDTKIDVEMIASGVMSRGLITGKAVFCPDVDEDAAALETHFYDKTENTSRGHESYIFICERPNIALLQLLQYCDPGKVGFIFRQGSTLCHLAIILRERHIPAVVSEGVIDIPPGRILTLDAITSGLSKRERVRI